MPLRALVAITNSGNRLKCKITDTFNDFNETTGQNEQGEAACPAASLRPTHILNLPILAFAAASAVLMVWL